MGAQTLPSEIARLSRDVEFWNTWKILLVALTAMVAIGLFVVQGIQLRRSRQLAALQTELALAKDRELQTSLHERDVKIGNANTAAAEANQNAAAAHERATILEGQLAQANTALAAQQEKTANAEARAGEAMTKAAEAEVNRLKLEAALMPRSLGTTYIHEGERKLFAGTTVLIVYTPGDTEAASLAQSIAMLLKNSNWTVMAVDSSTTDSVAPAHPHIMPGIHLRTKINRDGGAVFNNPTINAARVFVEQLMEQRILASMEPPTAGQEWPSRLPADGVLLSVGPRPQDFWSQKQIEILQQTLPAQMQEQIKQFADDQWAQHVRNEELERNKRERVRIIDERRQFLQQHNPQP